LVEVFDRRGVSFVSITQQFNTTTSMGRLTLNVLLSFAQFEREVIGERVRDKIAASKKKGMWMGGMPPLGHDVKDRKLVVNHDEARTVTGIYRRYLTLKSVHTLMDELAATGIRSKRRVRPDGTTYGGQQLSRGALYLLLQNRIYRGEITHKGNSYRGEHKAIIEPALWDQVQAVLAKNRIERTTGVLTKHPSLLTGLVFDDKGKRLTPTYAVKKGTRYRYYISTALLIGNATKRSSRCRIPAGNLEALVIDKLRSFFADPGALIDAMDDGSPSRSGRNQLVQRGHQIADKLESATPSELRALLTTLFCHVSINTDRVEIGISRSCLAALLANQSTDIGPLNQKSEYNPRDVITLQVSAQLKRAGREIRMLVDNSDDSAAADPSLLRIIAHAHDIQSRLSQDTKLTVHDVARGERVSAAYIYNLLRLPWLAPDITTAIINGGQPRRLSAKSLMRQASRLPADWGEQRMRLGFTNPVL
jgi:site-specific DNA recombinase